MRNNQSLDQLSRKRGSFPAYPMMFVMILFLLPVLLLHFLGSKAIAIAEKDIATLVSPTPTVPLIKVPASQSWEWIEIPSPVQDAISSCDFLSADDGWAVSIEGFLLHWDGKNWISFPDPAKNESGQLYAVTMLAPDNVWAVGEYGRILHWNGIEWKRLSPVTDSDLFTVSFVSKDLGFAAGGRGPLGNKDADWDILKWDGVRWNQATFPRTRGGWRVDLLHIISQQEGWASALDSFYRWDGKAWKEYLSPDRNQLFFALYDMSALSPNDVWAGGTNVDYDKGDRGVIIHWDGTEWKKVATTKYDIVNIRMFSPDMGWAIGVLENQQNARKIDSVLLNWDGVKWSEFPIPKEVGRGGICGADSEHIWIFGGKRVFTGPYSSEFHPALLQLIKKPTPTLVPTLTTTSTSISTAVPTKTFTAQPPAIQTSEVTPPQGERQPWMLMALIGGILGAAFALFFVVTRARR